MEPEKNEKVLAIYRAVWDLIDEGQDMGKMKVADITARAGIGKGTAYEYFRSKEEIVGKALRYDFLMQYRMLERDVHREKGFRAALECCFDWLEENADRRRFASQFVKRSGCAAMEEKDVEFLRKEAVNQVLGYVVGLGREEGRIDAGISDEMAILQILSQLFGYFIYSTLLASGKQREISETKAFLCDNIEKSLGR